MFVPPRPMVRALRPSKMTPSARELRAARSEIAQTREYRNTRRIGNPFHANRACDGTLYRLKSALAREGVRQTVWLGEAMPACMPVLPIAKDRQRSFASAS